MKPLFPYNNQVPNFGCDSKQRDIGASVRVAQEIKNFFKKVLDMMV